MAKYIAIVFMFIGTGCIYVSIRMGVRQHFIWTFLGIWLLSASVLLSLR